MAASRGAALAVAALLLGVARAATKGGQQALPTVQHLPTDPHDCRADLATWWRSWPLPKREWCCKFRLRCPEVPPDLDKPQEVKNKTVPANKTSADAEKRSGVQQAVPVHVGQDTPITDRANKLQSVYDTDPFDCREGLMTWWSSWKDDKRSWCCAHRVKCPDYAPAPASGSGAAPGPSPSPQQGATPQREEPRKPPQPSSGGPPPLPPGTSPQPSTRAVTTPGPPVHASQGGGPPPAQPVRPTPFIGRNYDCEGDARGWDEDRREYCCLLNNKGCPQDIPTVVAAVPAPAPALVPALVPTPPPALPPLQTPPPPVVVPMQPPVPPPAPVPAAPPVPPDGGDCNSGDYVAWTPQKQQYCCQVQNILCELLQAQGDSSLVVAPAAPGAPPPVPPPLLAGPQPAVPPAVPPAEPASPDRAQAQAVEPYDCVRGPWDTGVMWDPARREWCCSEKGVECEGDAAATADVYQGWAGKAQQIPVLPPALRDLTPSALPAALGAAAVVGAAAAVALMGRRLPQRPDLEALVDRFADEDQMRL